MTEPKRCAYPLCEERNGGVLEYDLPDWGRKAGELLRDPYCCGDHGRRHFYLIEEWKLRSQLREDMWAVDAYGRPLDE